MNRWTPIAASALVAFAVAVGCVVNEQPAPATPAAPPPPVAAPPAPGAPAGPAACNNQANMASALGYLRDARNWLNRAEHNKGGWREAAIAHTDNAIRETERGCAFADTH